MTLLTAWIGFDSRVPASAYLASDSRISWTGATEPWDLGRKTFAAAATPDLFAFLGTVTFPMMFLARFVGSLDDGVLGPSSATLRTRQGWLNRSLRDAVGAYPVSADLNFSIVHVGRSGVGEKCYFEVVTLRCQNGVVSENRLPTVTRSMVVALGSTKIRADDGRWIDGSGRVLMNERLGEWQESAAGGTSRSVFSAFCEAVAASDAAGTVGGPPQLVGLWKHGPARQLGVVYNGKATVGGVPIASDASRSFHFFDELFNRVDSGGLRVNGATHDPFARAVGGDSAGQRGASG